jgi:hypothetical protein
MSKLPTVTLRKLAALRELTNHTVGVMDIMGDLINEGVLNKADREAVSVAEDKCEKLFILMELANRNGKVQLMNYDWQLLPTQRVKLIIVTDATTKEYLYEAP